MNESVRPSVALSIRQPWAWLIVEGHKAIENRNWNTDFRGLFYIHTGKTVDWQAYDWLGQKFPAIAVPPPDQLTVGGIIGQARITGVVTRSSDPWFQGIYGFELADVQAVPFLALAGRLGFFPVPL